MDLLTIGHTLDALGKVMLGVTVLMVHWHISKEHKIDVHVLKSMRKERVFGVLAIILIIVGYALEVVAI